jgi:ABC-type glycerol-3-phosphate transport system substrate-binding protein
MVSIHPRESSEQLKFKPGGMFMKKFLLIALSLLLLLSTACTGFGEAGSGNTGSSGPESSSAANSASSELSGELTISVFNPMPAQTFLESAAQKFKEQHPNININVEAFAEMPEVKTAESNGKVIAQVNNTVDSALRQDYIKQLNTQLMSGAGADIIAMDVIPYYRYATGGQLLDLTGYTTPENGFNMADYQQNIIEGTRIEGKQYFIPLDYSFDLIAYDPSLFSAEQLTALQNADAMTYDEMIGLADSAFKREEAMMFTRTGGSSPSSLFYEILSQNYSDFLNIPEKTAAFNTGEFAELLNKMKNYEQLGYILPGFTEKGSEEAVQARQALMSETSLKAYYKNVANSVLMNYLTNYYNQSKAEGFQNRMVMNGVMLSDTDELLGLVKSDKGEVLYNTSSAYGINANTQNKELAWAFLQFLLSREMQVSSALTIKGIPVNKNAASDKAKLAAAGVDSGISIGGMELRQTKPQQAGEGQMLNQSEDAAGGAAPAEDSPPAEGGKSMIQQGNLPVPNAADVTLTEDQQKIYDIYMELINKYSAMVNTFSVSDQTITDIIIAETVKFFNGSKSAEEVSNVIQNKVDLYINE